MSDRFDDRAVSVTVGYVINLAIVAVLVTGLIVAGGGVLEGQTDRVIEDELEVIGQQVASNLMGADRLARANETDEPDELVVRADLPQRTAGVGYTMTVDDGEIVLETRNPDVTVTVPFRTELEVSESSVDGGPIRTEYDDGELVVISA